MPGLGETTHGRDARTNLQLASPRGIERFVFRVDADGHSLYPRQDDLDRLEAYGANRIGCIPPPRQLLTLSGLEMVSSRERTT